MKTRKKTVKKKKDLPGYPHYPDSEDIMNTEQNKTREVPVDIEGISRDPAVNVAKKNETRKLKERAKENQDREEAGAGPNDVTDEDLNALHMNAGEDDMLKKVYAPYDDSDLDVPGSELDDEQELLGSEDEENNYYSLGGDNHDDLEDAPR